MTKKLMTIMMMVMAMAMFFSCANPMMSDPYEEEETTEETSEEETSEEAYTPIEAGTYYTEDLLADEDEDAVKQYTFFIDFAANSVVVKEYFVPTSMMAIDYANSPTNIWGDPDDTDMITTIEMITDGIYIVAFSDGTGVTDAFRIDTTTFNEGYVSFNLLTDTTIPASQWGTNPKNLTTTNPISE